MGRHDHYTRITLIVVSFAWHDAKLLASDDYRLRAEEVRRNSPWER